MYYLAHKLDIKRKKEVEKIIADTGKDIPYDVIEMKDYGMMNGKAVYEFAKKLIGKIIPYD